MKHVLIDIRARNRAGVWRFGLNVVGPLVEQLLSAGYDASVIAGHGDHEHLRALLPSQVDLTIADAPFIRWNERPVLEAIDRLEPDLYYTTNYSYDPTLPTPVIPTVHDLVRLKWPELTYDAATFAEIYGAAENATLVHAVTHMMSNLPTCALPGLVGDPFLDYFTLMKAWIVQHARHVITISNSSASDLTQMLGLSPQRISIAPCGVSDIFRPRSETEVKAVLDRFEIRGPFAVTVGQASPGKRLDWLIETLLPVLAPDRPLVVVGEYALKNDRVVALAESGRGAVKLVGRVTDQELACLYTGTRSYATASIAEGYGLPPQEALACGAAVVCSDIAVFRETIPRGAATFFEPSDGAHLRSAIEQALAGRPPVRDDAGPPLPADWRATSQIIAGAIGDALPFLVP